MACCPVAYIKSEIDFGRNGRSRYLIFQISEVELGSPEVLAKAQGYLDACTKGTGTKFESLVLSCASDDQKLIRKKMEQLVGVKASGLSNVTLKSLMLQPDECYNLLFRPNSEQKTNEAPSDVNIMLDGSSTYPGRKIGCFTSENIYLEW